MEIRQAPQLQTVDLWTGPLKLGRDPIADAYALQLVNQTFSRYQWWRSRNHDQRWRVSDQLYFGSVPQKLWPGTSVPRAALGIPLTFEQVDLAVSILMQQLFGTGQDWFQVAADPGSDPLSLDPQQRSFLQRQRIQDARNIESHFRYLFRHGKNVYGHSVKIELEQMIQSVVQYGNGCVKVTWDSAMKRPQIEWVDLRDLYFDPHTKSSDLNGARSVIEVVRLTVDQLDAMRGDPRMSIPPRPVLLSMSQQQLVTQGDMTVQAQEARRKIDYQPGTSDWLPSPADGLIEVQMFTSSSRLIWVLNREWVAYNDSNPYGVVNYFMAPCYLVLKRAMAMNVPEVNEGNQLYAQGLMSAHLDEVNLSIFPPRAVKRGTTRTSSQTRFGPGTLNEYANPKEDVVMHQPVGATARVQETLAYLEQSAERRTGLNSTLAGAPKGSNLFRTQAGVQVASRPTRLVRIMEHIEDYALTPMLYFLYLMIRYHTANDQNAALPGVSDTGAFNSVSASSFQAPVHFSMHAASDMLRREEVGQAIPVIAQTLLAPQAQEQLTRIGKTIDFSEFLELVQYATGTANKFNLVRDLTPEESQALQQPDPKTVADQQLAQLDAQVRLEMGQMKAEVEKLKAQLQYEADTTETEGRDAREILKLVFEALQAGNPEEMRQKLAFAHAEGQQKLAQRSQEHQMKMAQQGEATRGKIALDQMKLDAQGQQMGQKMALTSLQSQHKMDLADKQAEHKAKMIESAPKPKPSKESRAK